jgi:hypothetical protein
VTAFTYPLTARIASFLGEIGLRVRVGAVAEKTALPGIDVAAGVLIVDEAKLTHPGDLLHEAGHLAVATPQARAAFDHDVGNDPAEEMMAIAWSYAAALHLGIDPAEVFHVDGYRGGSTSILENFADGRYFAVPMLEYVGLAYTGNLPTPDGAKIYPQMRRWLRE